MSSDVRDTGHDRLESLRTQLMNQLETQRAQLTQYTADTGDPGEAHTRAALIAATRQSLTQTGEALLRIADGRYGTCDRCGGTIPHERLEILPHARFCVPCQERQGR